MIAPYEVGSWFEGKGVKNVQSMNHGGAARTDFGRVKLTSAIHSSSMPDGSYGGNPCGFVVESSDGNFYYSGDTALTYDMKLIGETAKLDFAVFPIGDFFTMGIEDALRAAEFVGVSKFVGVHYDTFPPIKLDHEAAMAAARQRRRICFCRRSAKPSSSDFFSSYSRVQHERSSPCHPERSVSAVEGPRGRRSTFAGFQGNTAKLPVTIRGFSTPLRSARNDKNAVRFVACVIFCPCSRPFAGAGTICH